MLLQHLVWKVITLELGSNLLIIGLSKGVGMGMLLTSEVVNTDTLVLDSNDKCLRLIFKKSNRRYGYTCFKFLPRLEVHGWDAPSFLVQVQPCKALIDIPNLQARVISHSVKANGK